MFFRTWVVMHIVRQKGLLYRKKTRKTCELALVFNFFSGEIGKRDSHYFNQMKLH